MIFTENLSKVFIFVFLITVKPAYHWLTSSGDKFQRLIHCRFINKQSSVIVIICLMFSFFVLPKCIKLCTIQSLDHNYKKFRVYLEPVKLDKSSSSCSLILYISHHHPCTPAPTRFFKSPFIGRLFLISIIQGVSLILTVLKNTLEYLSLRQKVFFSFSCSDLIRWGWAISLDQWFSTFFELAAHQSWKQVWRHT